MKRRLLIVDNDPIIHVSLMGLLSSNDIEIFSVYHPIAALHWLERASVDLIICDIGLPKMNGLEFVRQLRQKNRMMAILFFTGSSVKLSAQDLVKLNILEVISKRNYDVFYFKYRVYHHIFGFYPVSIE